ncbi:Transposon Tf2-11 polyprotein [Araneus ventricosus]|uniref:RNA-directed DNA polymerase n=1 Tax=Araneus ventricosus TaxID=182803 RepID=A0A4Y2EPQ3_ARAVE|nr:Transposon Tf2-11 polyprotein [Araneus ventricosus]
MAQSLISSLTPFKGGNENFDFFIKQLNNVAKLEKWGEAKKILVLKLNLKDEALKFLVSNPKCEEIDHFDSLVKKLEEKFCKKPNFEEAESEEENIVNLTEKLKLSKFIEALRPDIRVEVKKLGPKNFKSAVAIAKNIDNALSDDGAELNVTDSGINQILSQQLSTNKQILELSEKVNAISSQNLCVNSLTEAPATNFNNVQSNQQSPCQICGKLNHKANNCFHYTRGNYYRGNSRANYNRTFRANNFHPYRSRANQRSNYGRGCRGIYKIKSYDFVNNKKVSHVTKKKQTNVKVLERHDGEKSKDKNVIKKQNSQTKKSKNKNSAKQSNQNKEKVLDNSETKVLMSCTNNSNNLPIVNIKICGIQLKCLIDSGANVSLIQPHIVDQIKTKTKVEYISRMVRIKTIDNTVVPYMSAINLKFKIEKKWFSNQFFVTLNPWNAQYHATLGYDFLQRNKVVIDTVNKQLLVGNQKFDFEENSPTNVCSETTDCDISESDKKESFEQINNNFGEKGDVSEETFHALNVKIANNITIQPFSTEIINLKVPKNISKNKDLIFIPKKNKLGYLINESLNVPTNANLFHTTIENNTNKVIHVRKNTIMGKLSTFDVYDIMSPSESEIYQINNLNLNEIHKMRRDELLKSDFKLDHLNDKDKKDMQDLLLKNYKVFSKSYKTLGETSAVIPEFSLLHNFPLQTKPYSIPLMAKKYAQQEINNLLEAGIIEPSSSSYCFPVIFIKKKQNPNDSNSEPKFRMVVDYRLLNSITETFKICLPKISEIIKNIAEFFSRKLTPAECKYPSIRRELLAIYASVKHFHDQLLGEDFELLTDAKPLTEYQSLDKKPEIVARWLLYLGTFSFTPTHIPGSLNPADFLSRVVEENSLNVNNITLFQPNDKLSMQNISVEQKQDAILSKIMNDLSVNKQCKQYFLDVNSGLLMRKNAHKNKKKIVNRIVIPKSLIKVCIETAHAPHFGVRKTFEFIIHKYQWKGMYLDTKNFCEHCEKCLENKPKAKLTQTQMIPKRNLAPGQCIAIDVVGKLPRSTDNKNFILTIIDHYSRYLEAYPLQNITSRTIINCLNKYFANFGLPKFLITDNATNFISNEMVEFLDRLNIQHRKSSIYYPMANGLLERAHRTMKESLASMCESTFQWSEKLLFFKLYYNNSIHSVTKFAPAEIFFGRKQNLPLDSFFEPVTVENESKYLKNIRNNMCSIRNEFAKNEEQYFKNNAPHIKGRKVPDFNLGDKVFVKNFSHPQVFQEKYKGPFEMIKILRNNNYVIKNLKDNKTMKLNVSKIFKQEQPRPNLRN